MAGSYRAWLLIFVRDRGWSLPRWATDKHLFLGRGVWESNPPGTAPSDPSAVLKTVRPTGPLHLHAGWWEYFAIPHLACQAGHYCSDDSSEVGQVTEIGRLGGSVRGILRCAQHDRPRRQPGVSGACHAERSEESLPISIESPYYCSTVSGEFPNPCYIDLGEVFYHQLGLAQTRQVAIARDGDAAHTGGVSRLDTRHGILNHQAIDRVYIQSSGRRQENIGCGLATCNRLSRHKNR